jgi:hypothetical protein
MRTGPSPNTRKQAYKTGTAKMNDLSDNRAFTNASLGKYMIYFNDVLRTKDRKKEENGFIAH